MPALAQDDEQTHMSETRTSRRSETRLRRDSAALSGRQSAHFAVAVVETQPCLSG